MEEDSVFAKKSMVAKRNRYNDKYPCKWKTCQTKHIVCVHLVGKYEEHILMSATRI